jgi:hypothetical protein
VFYGDTDSLVTNKIGFDNLKNHIDNQECGLLKLEKRIVFFHAVAPKSYICVDDKGEGDIKFKGVGGES